MECRRTRMIPSKNKPFFDVRTRRNYLRKNSYRRVNYTTTIRRKTEGILRRTFVSDVYSRRRSREEIYPKNGKTQSKNFCGYGKTRRNQSVYKRTRNKHSYF